MARSAAAQVQQQAATIILQGGLDLATPAVRLSPGAAIAAKNYESAPRGYRSIDGLERLDGHPSPSDASYSYLPFKTGNTALMTGAVVTGATSGATGKLLQNGTLQSGSYGASTAIGYLVLRNVVGIFAANENIQVGAVTKAVSSDISRDRGALNDADDTTFYQAAIAAARADIAAVPGSGPIRGIWMFQGVKYAFRNNADASHCVMWKATAAGWVAVNSSSLVLAFTAGGSGGIAINVGDMIAGAISGTTATVVRIVLTSGSFTGADAVGRLYLSTASGNFVAEDIKIGVTVAGHVAGTFVIYSTSALLPGGAYKFRNENFYGASNLRRMYWADGVNSAFEFDGTVATPIFTGMAVDAPLRLETHKNQLFLTFPGGSLQNSAPGNPYGWSVVLGAAEIGIGEEITNLLSAVSGVLMITGANSIHILYGNTVDDFSLSTLSRDAGAIADSTQNMGASPYYMDNQGIREMSATQAYGNFTFGTGAISQNVQPLVKFKYDNGAKVINSLRVRGKDQYRIFYDDGTGLSVYVARLNQNGQSVPEVLPFDLGLNFLCGTAYTDDGGEILLFGSDDGFVYQLDAGTSLDGATLDGFLRLPFYNLKSPAMNKQWKKTTVEMDATATTILGLVAAFDYGDPDSPPELEQQFDVQGGGGFWDESTWNDFYWSTAVNGRAEAYIDGFGANCSLTIFYSGIYQVPHTLQAVTYNYAQRGLVR